MADRQHTIVIVGAGTAGTSVAARLRRAGAQDVAIIDPYDNHYYQPLWTLVGGGMAPQSASSRPRSEVMPQGVHWIKGTATAVDPDARTVTMDDGSTVGYTQLVMAPGIQLDWGKVPGLKETIGEHGTSSNYRFDLAPKTWELIRGMRSGTAVFTMPAGPIKCAGAPQKIAYLAADHWRREGVLQDIEMHLVLPTPGMFGVPHFAEILRRTADDYGINVHLSSELKSIDGPARTLTFGGLEGGETTTLSYDMAHLVPPQSAPDWVKASPLSTGEGPGYVAVDKHTLQHVRHPDVFALGDAGSTPNSKTGAAIRKQAPVVVQNMKDAIQGKSLSGRYDGYASCPLTLSRDRILIAEFDYDLNLVPSNPLPWPDTTEPLVDKGTFKRYMLPAMYWHGMMKGLV